MMTLMLTPNEAKTLHLLAAVVVPRIVVFLAVTIGPWMLGAVAARLRRRL